jgi:cytochrome d ubiquinol oxidase subunit I
MLDSLDPLFLARAQFAFTISFHIIFPAFSIGLASFLAVLEGLWLATKRDHFLGLYKFWLKIFALTFAMGVVSGLVMTYQFGANWGPFAEKTAPVLGPLLAYEVLTAFFLEAGFLGVMLFGLNKVGPKLHFLATLLVAAGTLISAFWILSANSWMQTPVAFHLEAGRYVPNSWPGVIFNPSFFYRLPHMVLAAYLATAFAVGAVSAWHLMRDSASKAARTMFGMAVLMAGIVSPIQIFVGDQHGLNTQEYQPAKVAAMEGHFETRAGAPLILFGIPDREAAQTRFALEIPKLGSLILKHDTDATVTGLDQFPRADWPNVFVVFWAFRIMVGIGLLMLAFGLTGAVLAWRRRLFTTRFYHRWAMLMGPTGFVAMLAGWWVTEVGRQPYVVYGLMRTEDAASPIGAPGVALSLLGFFIVYLIIFAAGITYMLRLMARPPDAPSPKPGEDGPTRLAHGLPEEHAIEGAKS